MRTARLSLLWGAIGLVLGTAVGLIFFRSNLGPLIGLIFAGPMGIAGGALWSVARFSGHADGSGKRSVLRRLLVIWIVILVYTLFLVGLAPAFAIPAVALQLFVAIAIAHLLWRRDLPSLPLSPIDRGCRALILAAVLAIAGGSLVPPVVRTTAGSVSLRREPSPRMLFLLDGRLDASHHVPLFRVAISRLAGEWLLVILVPVVGCIASRRRS